MPLRSPNSIYDSDDRVTRAAPVRTPGVGSKYRDPISGARRPDEFFSHGGQGQSIANKLERESRR